jgi:hypothetical protein
LLSYKKVLFVNRAGVLDVNPPSVQRLTNSFFVKLSLCFSL